jgi:NADPH-dependent curcumin reductase CurA
LTDTLKISYYNTPSKRPTVDDLKAKAAKTGKNLYLESFLVTRPEYGPAYTKDHQEKMQKWIAEGSFKPKLYVVEGIDNAAEGFVGMLKGENFGKAVLKI